MFFNVVGSLCTQQPGRCPVQQRSGVAAAAPGGEAGCCLSRAACTQQPWGTWRLLAGSFCMLPSCRTWCAPDAPRAFLFVHPQHGYVPELCCLSCSLLSLLCFSFPSDGIRVWVVLYVLGRGCLSERKCLFHTALGFEGNRDQDWR